MALFGKKTKKVEKKPEPSLIKDSVSAKAPTDKLAGKEKKIGLAWGILKKAHVTEKATDLSAKNKYVFNVYPKSNKNQIKKSVEDIYGVNVISVNVINIPAKKRRLGRSRGWKSGYKKAVVRIKAGQEIELMPR